MKKLLYLVLLGIGVTGCSVEEEMSNDFLEKNLEVLDLEITDEVACGGVVIWPFGSMDHGWVEAKIDGEYLSVQIVAAEGKSYNQSRVEVATEVAYFPLKGGGLPVGQIQERDHFENEPYLFPLDLFGDDCEIFISAWAIITPKSGGTDADHWAGNLEFVEGNPNRGLYFSYCFECEEPEPGDVCESAYAYSDNALTLVSKYGGKTSPQNWGWYHDLNLENDETIKLYIYAAAGQNKIDGKDPVGEVVVDAYGGTSFKAYNGFSFSNIHVYVGDEMPPKRLPPGHFEDASTAVSNNFSIIIHMEVCADEESW